MSRQEPWLRGKPTDLDPIRSQLMFSFEQAIEDVERFTVELSDREVSIWPYGMPSVAFHGHHIGGSVDRLLTYALGRELSVEQFEVLGAERDWHATREELMADIRDALTGAAHVLRDIAPESYWQQRTVGRQRLPTTVGNLLVHIAEHTQRHVGQLIVTAKVVRGMAAD